VDGALSRAANWIAMALTGPFATALAVLVVSLIGLAALAGRLDKARMVRVVIGLFVLFAAPRLAGEFVDAIRGRYAGAAPALSEDRHDPPEQGLPSPICWTCN
jgi:type IV secretory pathway VirB2 component (pilin)